jgi:hypothetical protein
MKNFDRAVVILANGDQWKCQKFNEKGQGITKTNLSFQVDII